MRATSSRSVFEQLDATTRPLRRAHGSGRAFTAGGDIPGFLERSAWDVSRLAETSPRPSAAPKPVIAALRGYCFGVGLELALACDFRIAADDMQLAFPEVTIGMIPGSGGTQRLARLVGLGRAKDIVMRGRRVGAEEALALGLVTEVVPAEELDAAVDRLVAELSRHSPLALAMAKRVLNQAYDGPLALGLELEGLAYGLLQQTHDFREGVEAFTEKRPPRVPRRLAALPGEPGGEHHLVPRRDELHVRDRQTGPAREVRPAQERRERKPHLELVGVLRRELDGVAGTDVEVDLGLEPPPLLDRAVRRLDLLRRRPLRGAELLLHELAVFVGAARKGRRVRLQRLVLELRPGVRGGVGDTRLDHAGAESLEVGDPCLRGVGVLGLPSVADPGRLPQQPDRQPREAAAPAPVAP